MNTIIQLDGPYTDPQYAELFKPIPSLADASGWENIPIHECNEPLVAIGPLTPYSHQLLTSSVYFGEHNSPYNKGELQGAILPILVRQSVAAALTRAALSLPPEMMLLVRDGFRPIAVQQSLYDNYVSERMNSLGESRDTAEEEARHYVSRPSSSPSNPSRHLTGGAVDLQIVRFNQKAWTEMQQLNWQVAVRLPLRDSDIRKMIETEWIRYELLQGQGEALPVGLNFDQMGNVAHLDYYEENDDPQIVMERTNRRLIYHIMVSAGFAPYRYELWHWEMGTQHASAVRGTPAIYGPATLSEQNHTEITWRTSIYSHLERFPKGWLGGAERLLV